MDWSNRDLKPSCLWTKEHLERHPYDAFNLIDWELYHLRQCIKLKILTSARYHADKITFIRYWLKNRKFMEIPD